MASWTSWCVYDAGVRNSLFRHNGNTNHWLKVKLDGRASNRSGIGAKIRVLATIGGRTFWQMREISGQGGLPRQWTDRPFRPRGRHECHDVAHRVALRDRPGTAKRRAPTNSSPWWRARVTSALRRSSAERPVMPRVRNCRSPNRQPMPLHRRGVHQPRELDQADGADQRRSRDQLHRHPRDELHPEVLPPWCRRKKQRRKRKTEIRMAKSELKDPTPRAPRTQRKH